MNRLLIISLYVSVFLSGASILVIEILGTRILAPLFGTTIYVWSGLITVTLFSLALGYVIGGWLADKKTSASYFFSLFFLSGCSLLILFHFKAAILLFSDSFGYAYGPLIASMLIFTLPLFFLGMIDPFAIRLETKTLSTVGSRAGVIFGVSTVGGLLGALLSAYILLPLFSLSQIFTGLSYVLIFSGFTCTVLFHLFHPKKKVLPPSKRAKLVLLFFGVTLLFSHVFTRFGDVMSQKAISESKRFGKAQILYERQNLYSLNRVIAVPDENGVLCFAADGGLQTCIDRRQKDEIGYTAKIGLFMSRLPTNSNMLLLGLGGGKIMKEWGRDDIDTDIVDINPSTFYASETYLGVNFSERQHKHIVDARQFLRLTDKSYDLIIIDVSTTFTPPTHLYTKEFFELVAKRLTPKGVAIFQITEEDPTHDLGFQSLITTIQTVMPYTYADIDGVVVLLVMGKNKNTSTIFAINEKIKEIQKKYNAEKIVHEFTPIHPSNLAAPLITDDYNLAEIYWRKKIPLFKRFNLLIQEDLL